MPLLQLSSPFCHSLGEAAIEAHRCWEQLGRFTGEQRPGMKVAPHVRPVEGCAGSCFSLCCHSDSRELRGRGLSHPLTRMASEHSYLTLSLFHYSSCWTDLMELVQKVSLVLMCWMGRCHRLEIELVTPEWFSLTASDLPLILILVFEGHSQRFATS